MTYVYLLIFAVHVKPNLLPPYKGYVLQTQNVLIEVALKMAIVPLVLGGAVYSVPPRSAHSVSVKHTPCRAAEDLAWHGLQKWISKYMSNLNKINGNFKVWINSPEGSSITFTCLRTWRRWTMKTLLKFNKSRNKHNKFQKSINII